MNGGNQRRDRRQFQPPPWEQEAFQRFERERSEQEKEAELDRALADIRQDDVFVPALTEDPEARTGEVSDGPTDQVGEIKGPPPAQLEELMAGLRQQEPRVVEEHHKIANIVTAFLGVIGLGFIIWAGVLLGRAGSNAGALQMIASLLVMVWGFMMIAFAVVLWRKYNL
ncbi:MAG: hypothetical protein JXR33_02945 [Coriobacteriia bacterium]|nr:hypothetical protein [Coriobacteriia bacterium]